MQFWEMFNLQQLHLLDTKEPRTLWRMVLIRLGQAKLLKQFIEAAPFLWGWAWETLSSNTLLSYLAPVNKLAVAWLHGSAPPEDLLH